MKKELFIQNLRELQVKLKIKFKKEALLITALTHRSYLQEAPRAKQNERLEFFGDAVLKLIVSEYLLEKFPNFSEGDLSKIRAQYVSDRNLSQLAKNLNLGDYLRFSKSETRSGGKQRASILANSLEALLGAYYLDAGLSAVKTFLLTLFQLYPQQFALQNIHVDYKSRLQEILQSHKNELPVYTIIKEEGPDHQKTFHVRVNFSYKKNKNLHYTGVAASKKEAEQLAAKNALAKLDN